MPLYLSKLTALLVLPLGMAIVAALLAAFALLLGRNKLALGLIVAQVSGLWLCAAPVTAEWLVAGSERSYLPLPVVRSESADAAVVLGGGLGAAVPPRVVADLGSAADRVLHAARLYRAGKVGKIIVSGGFIPWRGVPISEAATMRDLLLEWGVPASAVIMEGASRNTRENAINTRELLEVNQIDSVLLVTSALHMRRALASFRGVGIDAVPSPTDYLVIDLGSRPFIDYLPSAEALALTSLWAKEVIGYQYYSWRGWVS
jgi:uncharacterized SAM-binding protein YcdF (DUF218 family)